MLKENTLIESGDDRKAKVWCRPSGEYIVTIPSPKDTVTLACPDYFVAMGVLGALNATIIED